MLRQFFLLLAATSAAVAQPQTHVVRVNADGSFAPQVLFIRSGDTVRWEGLTRTDSLIPVNGAGGYPALCSARLPYDAAKPNEFTGPIPLAPSGIFTLSPLDNGFVEARGSCPGNRPPVATGDGGQVLCMGGHTSRPSIPPGGATRTPAPSFACCGRT